MQHESTPADGPVAPPIKAPGTSLDKHGGMVSPGPQHADRILVVTGNPAVQRLMASRLSTAGYLTDSAATAQEARAACARRCPNLVILDLDIAHLGGHALLNELKKDWPELMIIVLTSFLSVGKAVRATQCGAFSFLVKPVQKSELLDHVKRAMGGSASRRLDLDWQAGLAARSQLMDERIAQFNEAASSDAHLLLTGENGTSRELLARAIHAASTRRDKPFTVLRCGAAGEFWSEPELFGRVLSNAFDSTGGGTLLVDEIGDLPAPMQLAFVEALDGVRVICTTSCDLRKLVDSGRLRHDLYEQIARQPVATPPLGRRREDLPLLIARFLEQATEPGTDRRLYSQADVALLAKHWPLTIRELFELVCENAPFLQEKILPKISGSMDSSFNEARDLFSREYLAESMRITEGNVTESARLAKRNRTDFYKLLARYRLRPDDFKSVQA